MTDHRIRLRRGWELLDPGQTPAPGSLTLPLTEFPDWPATPHRLGRWFNTPPLDPTRETLWLQLAAVRGLRSIRLNDHEVAMSPFSEEPLLVPLGEHLQNRNQLVLDVDLDSATRPPPGFFWGDIALLIRQREPG